jgi:hypothetical protein
VSCSLQRVDMPLSPTLQALGQAPFVSSCSPAVLTLNGQLGNVNPQQAITVDYESEPVPQTPGGFTHNASDYIYGGNTGVYVDFN